MSRGRSGGAVRSSWTPVLPPGVLLWIAFLFLHASSWGCSTRSETATLEADSTWVYPAKDPGGLEARITLCSRSVSKKTGERRGVTDLFTTGDNSKVYAYIDLENPLALGERPLDFRLVWIGPDDGSFYSKAIEYAPSDSSATLWSSISLSSDRRDPGQYALRVYLFRELIAERRFEVRHIGSRAASASKTRAPQLGE